MFNKIGIWVPVSLFLLRCTAFSPADSLETISLAIMLLQMREIQGIVCLDQSCLAKEEGEQEF